jgi:hypothetical protein
LGANVLKKNKDEILFGNDSGIFYHVQAFFIPIISFLRGCCTFSGSDRDCLFTTGHDRSRPAVMKIKPFGLQDAQNHTARKKLHFGNEVRRSQYTRREDCNSKQKKILYGIKKI